MVECAATASSVLPFRVQKMGWAVQLLEKSSSYSSETSFDSGMSDNTSTQLVFVAQTVEHVYLWDSVPWTIKEWSSPRDQILLLRARILSPQSWSNHLAVNDNPLGVSRPPHRSTNSVASSPMTTSKIAIRYGGDQGLACYSFQLTTRLAHTAWLASLVQGTLAAARNIGHAKFDCVWKNQECKLTIHLERGFILTDSKSGKDLWTHPYNTLYASNDDAFGIAFGIISPNVPPFMYSNLLRLLFSLELRLNNGRTFCRTAGVSDYCHTGLVSCQTILLSIYGCPLGLLSGLAFQGFDKT